jgi:hypothetical protein
MTAIGASTLTYPLFSIQLNENLRLIGYIPLDIGKTPTG